jgi:deoxyribonuclease-4
MLIGGHVSIAGGLAKAVERGTDADCDAIQIFHQSPRMWKPTDYSEDDFSEFRDAFADSGLESVVIHAVYLINCASKERATRSKSIASLTHALRVGDAIGADGVVLHAGARKGEPHGPSMKRAARAIAKALSDSDRAPVLLENTAGTQGPLGRNFDELSDLIDLLDGDRRVGVCLDCCHLFASGYEIRAPKQLASVIDEFEAKVGLDRLKVLHVNDSKIPLGGNRDQHAIIGKGELGERGIATFVSEPRFDSLPALIETGRAEGQGPGRDDVELTKRLRKRGLAARKRRARP